MPSQLFMGRYEVVGKLGEGGMGQVYMARQQDRDRLVVVKVMKPAIAQQPKFRDSFRREMQFMARFRHPFVVQLYDASVDDPLGPCIVMEFIDGKPLDDVLKRHRRLDPHRVGRLLAQLCLALEAANARGIVHRDLKPANLMIIDPDGPHERIKVMDFGLAKLSAAPHISLEKLSGADITIAQGTPEYMCPEQLRGDEVDHRGDLYSVGCMLFELLTGRLPFVRPTVMATLDAQVEDTPPPFSGLGATGPAQRVEGVVRHCLAKFPNERPQTPRELIQLYERAWGEPFLAAAEALAAQHPVPDADAPPTPIPEDCRPRLDPHTVVHHLQAWMPERIAVVKLRGFVEDAGGEVVASDPGRIRVRLGGERCTYQLPASLIGGGGLWGLLGFRRRVFTPIDMELHMEKSDSTTNQLDITMLIRPEARELEAARLTRHPAWKDCCDRIYRDLRSYLMGRTG
jgi:serine/threonine-protein kinase